MWYVVNYCKPLCTPQWWMVMWPVWYADVVCRFTSTHTCLFSLVPYDLLNKLSVHHNSLGSIFFELHGENWVFVKIRKNFSFTSHSERKNDVAQKIFIPQSCDWQTICSVDCREQNSISRFSILLMVWSAGLRKWNFLVSHA